MKSETAKYLIKVDPDVSSSWEAARYVKMFVTNPTIPKIIRQMQHLKNIILSLELYRRFCGLSELGPRG